VVAANFTDQHATVPFTTPATGIWNERLYGNDVTAGPGQTLQLDIRSNYGRVWTHS
jgi:hypothetical protein